MVHNCLAGFNSTVFAYGQTSAGKTHTMLGQVPMAPEDMPEQAGLIPRMLTYLFQRIEEAQAGRHGGRRLHSSVTCSCLEIYHEVVTDLLAPTARVQLREDAHKEVWAEGAMHQPVASAQEALQLLASGLQNRRVGETRAHRESSRSHCIFTCRVESMVVDEDGTTTSKRACLNLVDLAGSERQKVAESEGERLREASSINRSLSALGLVMKKLAHGEGHIPYRDSKLTFLLQAGCPRTDSLGGNARTVMIFNVRPEAASVRDTVSTLGFAQRAMAIQNVAKVNE
eukprot:jgi/Astpho2/8188/gw1.00120.238.1_t